MMTQQQIEKNLCGAATLLRGLIDAGNYKQYIFPLLFFKRICGVYDEEYQNAIKESGGDLKYAAFAENHRFQIPWGLMKGILKAKGEKKGRRYRL